MKKDELNCRVMKYRPDIELEGSGNVDYGHNLADAIMNIYDPQIKAVHGNSVEENKIRMEINEIKKNFHLNNILARLEKKISQNN
jgi:hypothetical protein